MYLWERAINPILPRLFWGYSEPETAIYTLLFPSKRLSSMEKRIFFVVVDKSSVFVHDIIVLGEGEPGEEDLRKKTGTSRGEWSGNRRAIRDGA